MRTKMLTVFFAGILFCALFAGAVGGALYALSDNAEAQGSGTWQVLQIPPPARLGWTLEEFEAFAHQIPADCDIVLTGQENMYLYRCPGS